MKGGESQHGRTATRNRSFELPTPEVARDLMVALLENAADLVDDARVLLQHGRSPRAYALAGLATEELGKTFLCLQVALRDPAVTARAFWGGWRHHGEKLDSAWAYHTAFLSLLHEVDFDRLSETPERMGTTKMSALYVDLDADGIQSPRNIEPGVARQMVDLAEEAIGHARQNLGMLTAEILPHLARLAPVIDRALERVVDESQPVSALSLLRRLLHAGQSDDISAIVAMLGAETDEQDSSPGNSGLPGGRSART